MTTDQIKSLTETQKIVCSLLAYECFYKHMNEKINDAVHRARIQTAEHACALFKVPDVIIWDIRHGKVKGLQNLNKLTGVQVFGSDYEFKF